MTAVSPPDSTVLLAFRAENVRSFRDPFELSLEATAMAEDGVYRSVPWCEGGRHPARVPPASFRSGQITRRPFRLDSECRFAV